MTDGFSDKTQGERSELEHGRPSKLLHIWSVFKNFSAVLVICIFLGWVIALCFNDPITIKQEDGTWRETSSWVGFQRVYVLTHPKCEDDVNDKCVTLTEYADEISAAYQLGRLDYVTVAVSLLAVVLGIAALFGFASIRQKAEVIAVRVSKRIAKSSAEKAKAKLSKAQAQVDAAVSNVEGKAKEVAEQAFQDYVKSSLGEELKTLVARAVQQEVARHALFNGSHPGQSELPFFEGDDDETEDDIDDENRAAEEEDAAAQGAQKEQDKDSE